MKGRAVMRTIGLIADMTADELERAGIATVGLLVSPEDTDVPLFDTTLIHARGAALRALEG